MSNADPTKADHGFEGLDLMEALRQCLACAVVIADSSKKVTGWNPGAERLFGLQAGQAVPQPLNALPAPVRDVIEKTFSEGKLQESTLSLAGPGRADMALDVRTSLLSGRPDAGVVAVITELAPLRELEQRVRHLDCLASIGTLAANMAHEIKNALVAVKTFLDLLVKQNRDSELADVVGREIRRIDSIVSQMLRFAGPAKPTFSLLHLHDVLQHSLRVIEPQLGSKAIRLKKAFAAATDLLNGDSYQLEQALLNLFFNAIEAMGPGGELSVDTDIIMPDPAAGIGPAERQLRLRVGDTGSGIQPENVSRLFEPFFTTKKKGVGLGLSITRRIIQEHSGTISVESALNEGTTFTILFPCAGKA